MGGGNRVLNLSRGIGEHVDVRIGSLSVCTGISID